MRGVLREAQNDSLVWAGDLHQRTSRRTNLSSAMMAPLLSDSETTSAMPTTSELRNQRVATFLSGGAFGQQAQRLMNTIEKTNMQ